LRVLINKTYGFCLSLDGVEYSISDNFLLDVIDEYHCKKKTKRFIYNWNRKLYNKSKEELSKVKDIFLFEFYVLEFEDKSIFNYKRELKNRKKIVKEFKEGTQSELFYKEWLESGKPLNIFIKKNFMEVK
jgi:hypothetical protein